MKKIYLGFLALPFFLSQSCIKEAPLNPEADIESFQVDGNLLTGSTFIDQSNGVIMLYLTDSAVANGIVPVITTSKGSKVSPASGDSIHFEKENSYSVTSESGGYQKTYR